jgi:hypothetical protein
MRTLSPETYSLPGRPSGSPLALMLTMSAENCAASALATKETSHAAMLNVKSRAIILSLVKALNPCIAVVTNNGAAQSHWLDRRHRIIEIKSRVAVPVTRDHQNPYSV